MPLYEEGRWGKIAVNIAIDVLKMENEGIKAVIKELLEAEREAATAKAAITNNNSDSSSSPTTVVITTTNTTSITTTTTTISHKSIMWSSYNTECHIDF